MIKVMKFAYKPSDEESEKASNSYLMSLIALIGGLPLPVVNLIATFAFFMGNRKGTWFVRWHCTQALLTQATLFLMNSFGFAWVMLLIFTDKEISNGFIAYIITIVLFNLAEFIGTVWSATSTRKGVHVEWWFYGPLTNLICRDKINRVLY